MLAGRVDVDARRTARGSDVGNRDSVFDDAPPGAVYAPDGATCAVTARDSMPRSASRTRRAAARCRRA